MVVSLKTLGTEKDKFLVIIGIEKSGVVDMEDKEAVIIASNYLTTLIISPDDIKYFFDNKNALEREFLGENAEADDILLISGYAQRLKYEMKCRNE